MSYAKKRGKIRKFFTEDQISDVERAVKHYERNMAGQTFKNAYVSKCSIQRCDYFCEVKSDISQYVASDVQDEVGRWMPGQVEFGQPNVQDIGNGMSRVQVPMFPS